MFSSSVDICIGVVVLTRHNSSMSMPSVLLLIMMMEFSTFSSFGEMIVFSSSRNGLSNGLEDVEEDGSFLCRLGEEQNICSSSSSLIKLGVWRLEEENITSGWDVIVFNTPYRCDIFLFACYKLKRLLSFFVRVDIPAVFPEGLVRMSPIKIIT